VRMSSSGGRSLQSAWKLGTFVPLMRTLPSSCTYTAAERARAVDTLTISL
jgi:hypothetical protein